ncbi:RING/FYVE/PHD zinc finger superfamily protein, putative isoform 4 [Hibiscus syriacus]|uniref:RING/FYVE/PHD zinc finger superfamily protein, putative isoform 4 n=1 Tax=Hibiscus syriacus TaxID=106335 RepID=A0A6A2XKI8_HIBSY|nr:RING/FYVE/PHD zinc finger superfamily protein, putative isoform 4 [Hibiscus syriacus]
MSSRCDDTSLLSGCKVAECSCPPLPRSGSHEAPGIPREVRIVFCCQFGCSFSGKLERNGVSHVEHRNVAVGDTAKPLVCNREPHSLNIIAAKVVRVDLFEKGKWLPVLQKKKNVEEFGISRACANEEIGTSTGSRYSRLCNICGRSETAQKMLICDSCEEAFRMRCCKPKVKKIPVDEWYCILCMKKKQIMLKEIIARRPSSITGGMGRERDVSSKWEVSPIELMLRDAESYRTSVRIGKVGGRNGKAAVAMVVFCCQLLCRGPSEFQEVRLFSLSVRMLFQWQHGANGVFSR